MSDFLDAPRKKRKARLAQGPAWNIRDMCSANQTGSILTGGAVVFCFIFAPCKTEVSDRMQRGRNVMLSLKNNKLVGVTCFQRKLQETTLEGHVR